MSVVDKTKPVASVRPPVQAFPQRADASAKQLVLFEMVRARAMVHGAILGLSPASVDQVLAPGKWSIRQTLLHLATRDQARLREMEAALRGVPPSWQGAGDPEMAAINTETMKPVHHLDWEETVRLLQRTRQQLMEELEMVPEDPDEVWGQAHPFGWMFNVLPPHDRHHAETIKRWRAERGV